MERNSTYLPISTNPLTPLRNLPGLRKESIFYRFKPNPAAYSML